MILSDSFFDFISAHLEDEPTRLLLSPPKGWKEDSLKFAVLQITLRKKFAGKFPRLLANPRFLLPDRSVGEQASSEATASYLSFITPEVQTVVDLTTGLGVNAISFARSAKRVTAVELSEERADILRHNLKALCIDNIDVVTADCRSWLDSCKLHYDLAFIDPARRDGKGVRSITLENYEPDVVKLIPAIKRRADRLLIKISPLFDMEKALREIPEITAFHLIEYRGECKELILDIDFNRKVDKLIIRCVEVFDDAPPKIKTFPYGTDNWTEYDYLVKSATEITPGMIIYIPSAGLRKARVVDKLVLEYPNLNILSHNTMLLVGKGVYTDFPGKKLRIETILTKKDLTALKGNHCNVISRNYPLSSADITKRYRLLPSGPNYLIATTVESFKLLLFCTEI